MSILLQIMEISISAVSLYMLIAIARTAEKFLETYLPKYRAIRTVCRTDNWDGIPPDCGETIWVFRNGTWQLSQESTCQPGYEPAPHPTHPGDFEGHTVRRRCRRIPKPVKAKRESLHDAAR